ncbi:hypothetical protein [Lysobacter sp. P5_B9]
MIAAVLVAMIAAMVHAWPDALGAGHSIDCVAAAGITDAIARSLVRIAARVGPASSRC